jgi:hypothetical protein
MATLHALMVGIDRYLGPDVPDLAGCRADIADATRFLRARCADAGTGLALMTLLDEEATGAAIVDGFRTHLAQAGPGDTALFWFSGHGSTASVPDALWHLEANGRDLHTLVCADSRSEGRPDLLDKELALLVDDVAAAGCHVVTVVDSCHSGGIARGPETRVRRVCPGPRDAGPLLPDLFQRYSDGPLPVRHVQLAACQPTELAREQHLDGAPRGLFSWALLKALRRTGSATTYRELLLLARNEVERCCADQRPLLFPPGRGLADGIVLGGATGARPATVTMRHGRDGWELDAGSCHGVDAGTPDDPTRVAVAERTPVCEARVTRVDPLRSLVEPIGWHPGPDEILPVVLSGVPMPRTTVAVTASLAVPLDDAIGRSGPGGGPSPYVRLVANGDAELLVGDAPAGRLTITDRDREPLRDGLPADARRVVAELEHIARWRQVKLLHNPMSRLAGAVSVELVEPLPGERYLSRDREAVRPDDDGAFRLAYRPDGDGWRAPVRFLRLRNHTARPLFCVVLDLTDRFAIHAGLFPGAEVPGCAVAPVAQGGRVEFSLPAGRPVTPGGRVRDWLMVIVAEDEFAAEPFEMSPVGELGRGPTRGPVGLRGIADRLGRRATCRDIQPVAPAAADDWWTLVVPVITTVP